MRVKNPFPGAGHVLAGAHTLAMPTSFLPHSVHSLHIQVESPCVPPSLSACTTSLHTGPTPNSLHFCWRTFSDRWSPHCPCDKQSQSASTLTLPWEQPSANDYGSWRISTPAPLPFEWDESAVCDLHYPPKVPSGIELHVPPIPTCLIKHPFPAAFPSLCRFLIPQLICPGITAQTTTYTRILVPGSASGQP